MKIRHLEAFDGVARLVSIVIAIVGVQAAVKGYEFAGSLAVVIAVYLAYFHGMFYGWAKEQEPPESLAVTGEHR